jgi:hypothetical protein
MKKIKKLAKKHTLALKQDFNLSTAVRHVGYHELA